MAENRGSRKKRKGAPSSRCVVVISSDQRQCLVKDVAYFRAERFRRIGPGEYRKEDIAAAETEIEAVITRYGAREDAPA